MKIVKPLLYFVLFLTVIVITVPYAFSLESVYRNRMDYKLMLDNSNMHDVDAVLEQIRRDIDRHGRDDYIILLGDSILYGSPGSSSQAIHVFLQQKDGAPPVYNLAFPAMQIGDLYTMRLKLAAYEISDKRLLLNIRYASFIPREPGPYAVFWLADELRKLDREAYEHVLPQLTAAGYKTPQNPYESFTHLLYEDWLPQLSLVRYKDYFRKRLYEQWLVYGRGQPIPDDALDDSRTWRVKKEWQESIGIDYNAGLRDPQLVASFSAKPFDLSLDNIDVYFLHKLLSDRAGQETWVVLSDTNHELMADAVREPGYADNLRAIDRMMSGFPVHYVNLEGVMAGELFTDHTHLTPQGNAVLADMLWPWLNGSQAVAAVR